VNAEDIDAEVWDAFQLLANETRLKILYALWNAPEWTATFTELKKAVGMRDSGQFQYHLNELGGTFLGKTDDGYTHLAGGIALYRAMLGSVTGPETATPISLDTACSTCGAALTLRYDNQVFDARCPDCDETVSNAPFLRAGLENRTDDDRANAFDVWTRRLVGLLRDGVCPWCASTVTHEFSQMESDGTKEGDEIHITHTCDRCGGFLRTTPAENVIDHPAVVAFCYDRGIDLTAIPHWKVDGYVSENTRLVSDDPAEVRVTIRLADDELTLLLDEEMRVREAE
jgi:hypothetical protein